MRLIVFEAEEWEQSACLRLFPDLDVVCTREPLNARTAPNYADAEAVATFVNSELTAQVLARLASLRLIATRSTGFDHIDTDYCQQHGITVCNVPDYGDAPVAEYAFALLLALDRHLITAVERACRGDFSHAGLRGFDLRGKTIGVIGTGRIGRRVIGIAKGFGMEVLAFDLRPNDQAAQALGFRYGDLLDVLSQSDVVTLHVPATTQTHHLISDREFAAMKTGAILINTARGSIIDVSALVRALVDKKVGAAGLDVMPEEPLLRDEAEIFRRERQDSSEDLRALLANHVLLRFPNVIVTPHIAYNTSDALQRILDTTIANIRQFKLGRPQNVVAAPAGPGR